LPSENRGKDVLICNLIKIFPLFFTEPKLRPPGVGTEATDRLIRPKIPVLSVVVRSWKI